jgi:hypothetical protein
LKHENLNEELEQEFSQEVFIMRYFFCTYISPPQISHIRDLELRI